MPREVHGWLAALVVLGLAACGNSLTPRDRLVDSVTVFCDALRWQQYDQASNYLPERERKTYLDVHDRLSELIDVTDLEVVRRTMGPKDTATVLIALSWIAKNDPVVRKTFLEQRWELKGETWSMVRERHVRGTRLPGSLRHPTSAPASQPAEGG
ncbi:MAG TPA: hypothetical protein VGQ83_22955 [Polyangia bacterium]